MVDPLGRVAAVSGITLHAPFAGWFGPLDEVPDPVFAERMMGDGFAIDPIEGVLLAPANGTVLSIPPSAHAVTLRLENGAELLMHIGLETVALGGIGFEPLVEAGAQVKTGDPLIAFDLDAVAEAAKALITPVVVANEGFALELDRAGREVKAGDAVARLTGVASAPDSTAPVQDRVEQTVRVTAPHGIHARPAARIVAALRPFTGDVEFRRGDRPANARSTVALLGLGVTNGETVTIAATGKDARGAVDAVVALLEQISADEHAAPVLAAAAVRPGKPVCASPGLAIGSAMQLRSADIEVPADGAGAEAERSALAEAIAAVSNGLAGGRGAAGAVVEAHRALLADPELAIASEQSIAEGRSAAFAWRSAIRQAAETIRATGDALLMERVADLTDLEHQVLGQLLGTGVPSVPSLRPDTILFAEDLLPSQFLALDKSRLAGICTAAGGPTAHVAILAASAGIPMVVAAGPAVLDVADGSAVILDADAAEISVNPAPDVLEATSRKLAGLRERRAAELKASHEDCRMADGTRIEIFANLGSAHDAAAAVKAGAEGCGLLRTEFLFLDRETAPDEEEQREAYGTIATVLGDRPMILRTLDIGGDKPVPYLPMEAEENPALGVRGVRLSLIRPDLLQMQFRAILRGVPFDQCRIMLPMVADLADYRAARSMLESVAAALEMPVPPLGVMIETPAAAMLAGPLAREAAFLSVGSNDLTQYTLAADRGNAGVSQRIDALHPAVLRLIREVGSGAKEHGRFAGVCGGLASDPLAAPILIGLGVTELSATPAAIPRLKAVVRQLEMDACIGLAQRACEADTADEVRAMVREAVQ